MSNCNDLCVHIDYDDSEEIELNLGNINNFDIDEQIKIFLNKASDLKVKNSYLYIGSFNNNVRNIEKILVFQNENYKNILRNNKESVFLIKEENNDNSKEFFVFSNNIKLGKDLYHSRKFKLVKLFNGLNLVNQMKRA